MQKGGGLFFSPLLRFGGTLGVSASLDFPKLVSRSWKGYSIPPGCINESVESSDSLQGWVLSHSEFGWCQVRYYWALEKILLVIASA